MPVFSFLLSLVVLVIAYVWVTEFVRLMLLTERELIW